jgi:hypothetical protein
VRTTPHPSDFDQRHVPSPMELNGNFSPRRMIKQTATMQTHMSDSFHIAAETVNVGEKYKTACRTTIIPNRAIASPSHVNGNNRRTPLSVEAKEVSILIL